MIKSKLINIYLHFNEKEKKEFLDFVRSPVHNQHEGVTKLYQFIFGLSDINPKSVLKEKAFKKVFGNIAFDNMKIIHVMSYLAKVMEDYLAFKEWKGQTYQRDFYALKSFRRRRMEKLFQKKIKQFDKIKEKEGIKDTDYYYHKYKVGIEHVQYISEQNRNIDSLQEVSNSLNIYFIAEKLKQAYAILSNKTVNAHDYEFDLLEPIIQLIENNPKYQDTPAINIYYTSYKLLMYPSQENFQVFKAYLLEYKMNFKDEELRDLYLMAINYAIKMLNTGKENALHELFELYQMALESNALVQDNVISRLTFINIVSVGVKANKFAWTQTFIDEYRILLEDKYKESIYNYTQAKLFYVQKKYKDVMLLLMQTDFDEFLIHLDGKKMLLKIFHELGEIDALDALLDSLRIYIHRKKLIGYHKTNYLNIISIMKKIIRLPPNDSDRKEKLRKEIESKEILTERAWLLERLGVI